jgi:hypothetical protein
MDFSRDRAKVYRDPSIGRSVAKVTVDLSGPRLRSFLSCLGICYMAGRGKEGIRKGMDVSLMTSPPYSNPSPKRWGLVAKVGALSSA